MLLALSVLMSRGGLKAAGISCCAKDVFFLTPVTDMSEWCRLMWISVFEVLPTTYSTSVKHRWETVSVWSSTSMWRAITSTLYCEAKVLSWQLIWMKPASPPTPHCPSLYFFVLFFCDCYFFFCNDRLWQLLGSLPPPAVKWGLNSTHSDVFVVWMHALKRDAHTVTAWDEYKHCYTPNCYCR